ncbi:DUF4192 domain-containing protein [Actinokineospora sp. UTMC 2448]|uniref:DUF4192 domain-containing protein n=1 Tax=Actinokineospora sp. UTMC 2448 TaxID=2268449 RepID=UPI0021646379|nr:DUF4192 domain-containing protein [Actinokineospora sp. UTMC 2448]UVS80589.1 hypothetical protein Actkin_04340 [Actinokineospora sp. UTMC 2448]
MYRVELTEPGEVIRSIPALLGFYPRDSLVVVAVIGAGRHPMVVRADLSEPDKDVAVWCAVEAHHCGERVHAVMVVIVGGDRLEHDGLVDELEARADRAGIPFVFAAWIDVIEEGRVWESYTDSTCGRLADPRTSPLAVLTTYEGKTIQPSREAIEAGMRPTAAETALARRRELIEEFHRTLDAEAAEGAIRHAAARDELPETNEQFAVLVAALDIGEARDQAIRCMVDGDLQHYLALWQHVLHNVDGPDQRHPATMLAVASFLDGDSVRAAIATEIACRWAEPGSLPHLIHGALKTGMPPETFRAIAHDAIAPD